ncbi:hypothetical protein NUM3379_12160 [Kineococcus sp. NUM-3379]
MTHHDKPEEHQSASAPEQDTDADPGTLNPRDLRGEATGDAVAETDGPGSDGGSGADTDTDGDPGTLNPRG